MKIFICVYNLFNGGAERVASLWANGFAERGDDVTIVLAEKEIKKDYMVARNVAIENIWVDGFSLKRYLKKIYNLRRLIKRRKPDVAIGVMPPWDIWLLIATYGTTTKPINTIHNSFEKYPGVKMTMRERYHKYMISRRFPAVTVLTEADRIVIGNKLNNVYIMPNPLAFEPCYNPNEKENVILAVGRLDSWYVKGIDVLIEAWARIAPNHPDWQLKIVGRRNFGGGKDDPSLLDKKVAEFHLEKRVHFLGFCSDMKPLYRRSSIFAFPSRYDGFGMALIEAMSQGCACVACDFKGRQSEIISCDNEGVLCNPDDINALANALDGVICNKDLRLKLQKGAVSRAEDFSLDIIIKRWYELFKKIGLEQEGV